MDGLRMFTEGGPPDPPAKKKEQKIYELLQPPVYQIPSESTGIGRKVNLENLLAKRAPTEMDLAVAKRTYTEPVLEQRFIGTVNDYYADQSNPANFSKDQVKKLQQDLISKGYDLGATKDDGVYGRRTRAAYEDMMAQQNMDMSLADKYYRQFTTENKPAVTQIQKKLVEKGLLGNQEIDGLFGNKTKAALEKYNAAKGNNPVFSVIPQSLDDKRCAAGMCDIFESNGLIPEVYGMKHTDAWNMLEKMEATGNSNTVYNIYDDPSFKNVKSSNDLLEATRRVKSKSQTSRENYKVGDIVGIYNPGSEHHSETLGSKTHNTHVGFVSKIDRNGNPIITHNVDGRVLQDPYTKLTTTWISRPNYSNASLKEQYNSAGYNAEKLDENALQKFEQKIERGLTDPERKTVTNIMQRAKFNSKNLTKMLKSSADPSWVEAAAVGIAGAESAAGLNATRNVEELPLKKQLAHTIKSTAKSDISLGVGKIKYSKLDPFARKYFGINSPEDLKDDNKSMDAISYSLIKNYEKFKDYAAKFPELGLTEQDVRNMSILAHNQGTAKLLKIGRNTDNKYNAETELAELRKLYSGKVKDISSTDYKHVPLVGEALYNALEEPAETYISKVNRYQSELYDRQHGGQILRNSDKMINPLLNLYEQSMMQNGGTNKVKNAAESSIALASLVLPFPANYIAGVAGSTIDFYDAYNADTKEVRDQQLAEALLGLIPYGRMVKGMKVGTDYYKTYKALRPLRLINNAVDVKDIVDPNFKNGGQHGGLDRWFAEKWVDIKTGKPCGRQEGENRSYPACRPSRRVSSETPKTRSEMSPSEKAKFKQTKTSSARIPYNHKRN
jgi:hypothetical protein